MLAPLMLFGPRLRSLLRKGLRRRAAWLVAAALALITANANSAPKPLGKKAQEGLRVAKSGDCVAAVPLLEKAETDEHRPVTASALAACHVSLGELLLAYEIYAALARESDSTSWDKTDRTVQKGAAKAAGALDERIPRLRLEVRPADLEQVEVTVGGVKKPPPPEDTRVPPDEKTEVVVSAPGYTSKTLSILMTEGEKKTVLVELDKDGDTKPIKPKKPPPEAPDGYPTHWIGAHFRGLFVPQFFMNFFADGGTNAFLPGVGASYTARLAHFDIEPSLTFTSYSLGPTPFKASGRPNTEWEILESDLWGAAATVEIFYRVPVSGAVEFRIGGSIGVGFAVTGDVFRWQAFPEGDVDDPSTYQKCNGPNDPAGTFRYCNQLDKDANRYGEADTSWFEGGVRPIVYPWVALPQMGFVFHPIDIVAIDLEVGATLNGLSIETAMRFGL